MKFDNRIKEAEQLQQEINSMRPLSKHALKQLKEYYRIGLTYSSNALEGNSLTESETKVVLEDGITIGGKPLKDHFEAIGHSDERCLSLEEVEKRHLVRVLKETKGNKVKAAKILGIDRRTLYRMAERFGLDLGDDADSGELE